MFVLRPVAEPAQVRSQLARTPRIGAAVVGGWARSGAMKWFTKRLPRIFATLVRRVHFLLGAIDVQERFSSLSRNNISIQPKRHLQI